MNIIWLGHGSWRIEMADLVMLVDPWLQGNPSLDAAHYAAAKAGATHILLTHGHGDHASEVVDLARELDIPVVGQYDLMSYWQGDLGLNTIGFNKGGTVDLGGVLVTMVNAVHSSSLETADGPRCAGSEAGFVIRGEGHSIYLSGDTDVMADMEIIAERWQPDIGILSAGGYFTMDMEGAAYAAKKYFDFKMVIPGHYKTFPILAQDAQALIDALPDVDVRTPDVMEPITL